MANFFTMACCFLAIIIETSSSDLQKKVELKNVNDVKEHCARALSVDPEMNMDCCITGSCVKRTGLQLDILLDAHPITNDWFYCDGKHIAYVVLSGKSDFFFKWRSAEMTKMGPLYKRSG